MRKPSISVIIPAYNEEKYLPVCLASLKKQTYPPLEIIVVDNNSTDKTAQIAKKFGVKVVFEKKQGIAYARDVGFKAAQGEIVARTDADSEIPPNWLEKIVKIFQTNPKAVALTGTSAFYDTCTTCNLLAKYWFSACLYFFKVLAGHHQFHGPNMAIKKEVLSKISPFSDNLCLHEDMDLACHIAAHGEIIFDPSLVVFSSARRLKESPLSALIKYPAMWLYGLLLHCHPFVRNHRKSSIRAKRR